ncbi:craniofacial development protein 2-like [Acyrthosiphon pisum]|uniref:Endonuclease/exonuclease/phosphatase domain-containing protein n=1 Tax=Acyrthosiphon pisum TaxID=7029 RepID=A0A8R2F8V5_ACYPI|nr:craniofacial development protein 2-like [Acyrthosiphon pisum]|eukprot:XP_008183016.1 PREDICTED: craniofacial development protein 2-like [Acyrthosiphon pisum]
MPRNRINFMDKRLELGNGIKLGSWNVRTLNKPGALQCVLNVAEAYEIQILALQEIRWLNKGSLKKENLTLFYSSLENKKHENGVGIMIHDSILPQVKIFKAINNRLCCIILKGRIFNIGIICCYGPTEDGQDEKKEEFMEELDRAYDDIPRHCIKVLLGDFNAKIGREGTYKPTIGSESLHHINNDNGTRLINMAIAKDLIISSTYFPRKDIHKQTWISPDGHTKNQINYVLIDKKHKGCINNVRSYRGADADSDHYLLIIQFKLKLSCRWRRKNTETKRFDIGKLKNKEVAKKYEHLIQSKLAQNTGIHGENEVENQWSRVTQAIKECATDMVGWTEKTMRKDWFMTNAENQ